MPLFCECLYMDMFVWMYMHAEVGGQSWEQFFACCTPWCVPWQAVSESMRIHVETIREHPVSTSIVFCLIALGHGLSLNPKLVIFLSKLAWPIAFQDLAEWSSHARDTDAYSHTRLSLWRLGIWTHVQSGSIRHFSYSCDQILDMEQFKRECYLGIWVYSLRE